MKSFLLKSTNDNIALQADSNTNKIFFKKIIFYPVIKNFNMQINVITHKIQPVRNLLYVFNSSLTCSQHKETNVLLSETFLANAGDLNNPKTISFKTNIVNHLLEISNFAGTVFRKRAANDNDDDLLTGEVTMTIHIDGVQIYEHTNIRQHVKNSLVHMPLINTNLIYFYIENNIDNSCKEYLNNELVKECTLLAIVKNSEYPIEIKEEDLNSDEYEISNNAKILIHDDNQQLINNDKIFISYILN
jgi:hypothetical protein